MTDEDGQDAVVARARPCCQPVRDVALKHDRRIDERNADREQREEPKQDRRPDVVGEVPDHSDRPAIRARRPEFARQALVRYLEKVALDDGDIRECGALELRDQIAIDFAGDHLLRPGRQRSGQRAATGADFQKDLVALGPDRADDLVNPGGLEKMLAESLLGSIHPFSVSAASPRQYCVSIASISSSLRPK